MLSARSQAKERMFYMIPFVQLSREHKLMNSDKEKISGFLEIVRIIGRKAKKGNTEISGSGGYAHGLDCADGLTNEYKFQNSLNCVFYIRALYIYHKLILLCKAVKKSNETLS